MNLLKYTFWNTEQSRLRTGYRIILQLSIFILIGKGLQNIIGSISPDIEFSSSAPLWFFLVFAGVKLSSGVISVWIAGRYFDRRYFKEFGFHLNKHWWIDFVFGLGLGIFLMCVIFFIQYSLGWIEITDLFVMRDMENFFILPISVCFFVFISVSISEEIVSRGYLLTNLAEGLNFKIIGPKGAIIIGWFISSTVFGIAHIDNPNATLLSTLNIIIGGLFLGIGYVMTGRLAIPIGIHLTWNFFQANVFGYPVSGFTIPSEVVTFIKVDQIGPEIWTGGAFGPEASLLGSLAILLGIILTFGWIRYRNNSIGFQLSIASSPRKISKIENDNLDNID
jgi:membrane protease YdiL (CAAX protease family)